MSMRSAWRIFALGILASGLIPKLAFAATASASFGVSATVQATCQATANATAFKTYTSAPTNKAPTVSVICSNSALYNVVLSAEPGTGATLAIREIIGSGTTFSGDVPSLLPRGIVNRGQIVGAATMNGNGKRPDHVLADHGQISAGRYAADDAYIDTIVVTVTY
jgi:spore coat protein U-like protein